MGEKKDTKKLKRESNKKRRENESEREKEKEKEENSHVLFQVYFLNDNYLHLIKIIDKSRANFYSLFISSFIDVLEL